MKIEYGNGTTEYGPGVDIHLTGEEVATAVEAFLAFKGTHIEGARTITVNGDLCRRGHIYVDPSGFVIDNGKTMYGRGPGPMCHITSEIMKMVKADFITMSRAAEILGITVSEARRIYKEGACLQT
jgi:hypothetical protein